MITALTTLTMQIHGQRELGAVEKRRLWEDIKSTIIHVCVDIFFTTDNETKKYLIIGVT